MHILLIRPEQRPFYILWLIFIVIEILVALNIYVKSGKDGQHVSGLRKFLTMLPFIMVAVFLNNIFTGTLSISASLIITIAMSFLFHMTSNVELKYHDSPAQLLKTFCFNLAVSLAILFVSYLFANVPVGIFVASKSTHMLGRVCMWLIPPIMITYAMEDFVDSINNEYNTSLQRELYRNIYKMVATHILSMLPLTLYLNSFNISASMSVNIRAFTFTSFIMSNTQILAGSISVIINIYLYYLIFKPLVKVNRTAFIGAILLSIILIESLYLLWPNILWWVLSRLGSIALMTIYTFLLKRILGSRFIESTA